MVPGSVGLIHFGVVDRADALDHLVLGQLALGRIDARNVARHVGDQHAPRVGIVEGAPQRHMQAAVDDDRAQDLDAALLERGRRDMERIENRRRLIRIHVLSPVIYPLHG